MDDNKLKTYNNWISVWIPYQRTVVDEDFVVFDINHVHHVRSSVSTLQKRPISSLSSSRFYYQNISICFVFRVDDLEESPF